MTLLLAFALSLLLCRRLGLLRPRSRLRTEQRFDELVLQLGEEVEWEEQMTRVARRLPPVHRLPQLSFKPGRP